MILLRYLIFYVFVYVNTKNYLLDIMEGISHLICAVGFVHQFGKAQTLHRSRQCLQFLAIRQFVRKHLRKLLLQSRYSREFHLHLYQAELGPGIKGCVVGLQKVQIIYPGEERLQFILNYDLCLLAAEIIETVTTAQQKVYLAEIIGSPAKFRV